MLQNYLKIAWRNLTTQRSYTLLNILGLSVGMAGGLLLFLFIRYHLSTDRHHTRFDRIFRVVTDLHLDDGSVEYYPEAPLPMARTLRTDYPQVDQAAFLIMNRELIVSYQKPGKTAPQRFQEHSGTGLAEPELFDILDYQWLRGNPETALREPNTVVITESWAKKYFGEADPMGQTLNLNHKTDAKVTGVLADPPRTTDVDIQLFISMATLKTLDPQFNQNEWSQLNSNYRLFCTLKNPEAVGNLEAAMPALSKKQFGESAKYFHFHFQPLREVHFDVRRLATGATAIRPLLLWSLGLVGVFLVLTACINFVNLATAQALRRSKEVGIRKTLGSTRAQLVRQFLLETALIVLTATVLALLLAFFSLPLFNRWSGIPLTLHLDGLMLGFIFLLIGVVILLAGGYPAAVLSGFTPWAALKGKIPTRSLGSYSVRQSLVVVQFVVCQALIIGSLVVAMQVRYIQNADLGLDKENVVVVPLPKSEKSLRETFKNELLQYPEIKTVSASYRPPSAQMMNGGSFKFESDEWAEFPIRERLADANYLKTYGLQLVAGRNISESDTLREYLVNEAFLRKMNIQNPQQVLGRRMQYHLSPVLLPIVGVVKDFHQRSLRDEIGPCFIASKAEFYKRVGIRIAGQNPAQTVQRIQKIWEKVYPDEVFEYEFLDEQLAKFYETESLLFRLVNTFAGIAMLICGLGLYGLVSLMVVQRTKEIGVRKVLGASVASIVALLSKDFIKLVVIALVIASPMAGYAMKQWLNDFAYKISIEWWMFALAGGLAVVVALLTVSFQSVKAALANPVTSLRSE
ncbi:putative ABC transport system permease protein [Larkinella arboricola]|uniref:Putative ABC transport system permease protein n=1 Tax=Larkinella arboricola TaxID=643671 RepID=A0A327X986_LARAB|nr:ABC transporter permease [Larkinella arboricola]RAK02818.1 putative ABC transport system permease protein [Larkinella arboricola]